MSLEQIVIRGAREHNLKNIDLEIPRNKLVVITGVSGSGKSSLAFDTIYAEGQRRYVESLSSYARQFLGRMDKPDVDYIEGLSPSISIDQKGTSHNPRSTVGTVTEIYDYLRLLYARVGKPHCPVCGRPVERQTIEQIADRIFAIPADNRLMILAPIVRDRKGEFKESLERIRKKGFVRARIDGIIRELSEDISLDKAYKHTVEIVVDRLISGDSLKQSRVHDSVETAMSLAQGLVAVSIEGERSDNVDTRNGAIRSHKIPQEQLTAKAQTQTLIFSEHFACPYDEISLSEIEPRTFSFNSPHGACPDCSGLGFRLEPDPELIIPDKNLTLLEGALSPWASSGTISAWHIGVVGTLANIYEFPMDLAVKNLPEEILTLLLYGEYQESNVTIVQNRTAKSRKKRWYRGSRYHRRTNRLSNFEGVIPNLVRRYRDTDSDWVRGEIERYMAHQTCPTCNGGRLKKESLAVTVCGESIMRVCSRTIDDALDWVTQISEVTQESEGKDDILSARDILIADQILKEIQGRMRFLADVGLNYISLDRMASTLSGGEAQRIRLATQIGSGLMGVLYVCDEPTIGLHPADDYRLINTLEQLRDLGNSVIVVEHDEAMMRAANYIVDMGPGAGHLGGHVAAIGSLQEILDNEFSVTGSYLSGRRSIPMPTRRRKGNGKSITVGQATANNLQNLTIRFPLGRLVCVSGVSGSGKSTLVNEILYKKIAQLLYRSKDRPGAHKDIKGVENIDKVIDIDQSPIGRTPRSNPATYTGSFTPIRELFASLPEARIRGYKPGRFSFNVKGGRCEACEGAGYLQIEMQFLPDVTVPCELCQGDRYNREALEVKFHGYSIADVLNMTVDQALDVFQNIPKIRSKLETIQDVGLGYIHLGQPATTLSGGEAQRVKLATELSHKATGQTLYILDEPTTGLSFPDVEALLKVLHRLVDSGNTVIVIEHHLDVIKNSDWIVDLGPGAGNLGGGLVATGTPETIVSKKDSLTGHYLNAYLMKESITKTARVSLTKS